MLIYIGTKIKEQKHTFQKWFQDIWSFSVYDVIFLSFSTPTPKLYMWYPYSATLVAKNFCWTRQEFHKNLRITQVPKIFIPNPLKVRIVLNPPSVINTDRGRDVQIIKEIAKILQTELVFSHSDKPLDFGRLLPNGTGALAAAYHHETDLIIGGFMLNKDRYTLLDTSYSYYSERWYWCVPRAAKVSSWKHVFITMKLETWSLIFATYITITTLLWSLNLMNHAETLYGNLYNWFFINFRIFLGVCIGVWPRSGYIRLLTLFWVLVSFVLDTMYSTKFITLMGLGVKNEQIKTTEELLDSNLEIWLKKSALFFFNDSPSLVPFLKGDYKICKSETNCLSQVVSTQCSASFASESSVLYVQNQFIGANNLPLFYCFNNDADVSLVVIGMHKGFALKGYINRILRQFMEGGFIQLWQRQPLKLYKTKHRKNSPTKINLDFFKAPLCCWIVGIILATIIFVVENVANKYKMFVNRIVPKN